ncbi:MAG: transposase [Cyanobacteria bacterium P01_F01_bin.56]
MSGRHHQSHGLLQAFLRDVFAESISVGAINRLRREVKAALAAPVSEAKAYLQQPPVIGSDETGFTQHNGEGNNLQRKRDWLWVLVSPLVTVFDIALSRSQLTAQQLMVRPLAVVTADRYGAYNWLPVEQSQVC